MQVTVFGLGEAGSLIAKDLVAAGIEVCAFDPEPVPTPRGVNRHGDPGEAVDGTDLVVAITAAADARTALEQARDVMGAGLLYADLSTAAPDLKRHLADAAAQRGVVFADVALMAPVPGNGFSTPAFVSGPGAAAYARFANEHGGKVEVLSEVAGHAAGRKLLRSIVTKGITALLIESLWAADAHGSTDWLWPHIVETITEADETLLVRLLDGTPPHVDRRLEEMEAAAEFLTSLGVDSTMTRATIDSLVSVRETGLPPRREGG